MRPPVAATTLLSFAPDSGATPFELPAGVQFKAVLGSGLVVPFRTRRDLDISPVNLRAIQVDTGDGNIQDMTGRWDDQTPVAAFGANPQAGAALYLGFDELFSQIPLALGFGFAGPGHGNGERHRIIEEWEAQQASCVPHTPAVNCGNGRISGTIAAPDDVLPP